MGHPVVELRYHGRFRRWDAVRGGEDGCRQSFVLQKIVEAKEDAKQAVVVVMMGCFEVPDTLQTVVVGIDCGMMHMQRRQNSYWQIAGQQYKRCKVSQKTVHLSACKDTVFFKKRKKHEGQKVNKAARFFITRSDSRMARMAMGIVSIRTTISIGMLSMTGSISSS